MDGARVRWDFQRMKINVILPRETALALGKIKNIVLFEKKPLTVKNSRCIPPRMADQRHPDKRNLTVWIPRALYARLQKKADQRNETLTQFVTNLIQNATQDVKLTPEDYRQLAHETQQAIDRLSSKRDRRSTGKAGEVRKKNAL